MLHEIKQCTVFFWDTRYILYIHYTYPYILYPSSGVTIYKAIMVITGRAHCYAYIRIKKSETTFEYDLCLVNTLHITIVSNMHCSKDQTCCAHDHDQLLAS